MEDTLDKLYFPVEKVSVKEKGMIANPSASYLIIANIDGGEKLLNAVSERYNLVPCSDLFPRIIEMVESEGLAYTVLTKSLGHAKFYVHLHLNDILIHIPNGPTLSPVLKYQHSYDNSVKFDQYFGLKDAKTNRVYSAPLQNTEESKLRIASKHTDRLDECILRATLNLRSFLSMKDTLRHRIGVLAASTQHNYKERLEIVLSQFSIKKGHDLITAQVEGQMRAMKCKANDWIIYSAIHNGYLFNDDLNIKHPEFRDKIDADILRYLIATTS